MIRRVETLFFFFSLFQSYRSHFNSYIWLAIDELLSRCYAFWYKLIHLPKMDEFFNKLMTPAIWSLFAVKRHGLLFCFDVLMSLVNGARLMWNSGRWCGWSGSTGSSDCYYAFQDIFESMGQFVDGLKFSGGSHSLMPKSFIEEVVKRAHQHDVYVSTGDWAEHLIRNGPSAFKEYVEVSCATTNNYWVS